MNKRVVGFEYESMAVKYLTDQGYIILERNYHNKYGEIDIIARHQGILVGIEVKYRQDECFGDPLEAVDIRKQKRISRTFFVYYASHGYEEVSCRFDVIAINGKGEVIHIKDAFDFIQ